MYSHAKYHLSSQNRRATDNKIQSDNGETIHLYKKTSCRDIECIAVYIYYHNTLVVTLLRWTDILHNTAHHSTIEHSKVHSLGFKYILAMLFRRAKDAKFNQRRRQQQQQHRWYTFASDNDDVIYTEITINAIEQWNATI